MTASNSLRRGVIAALLVLIGLPVSLLGVLTVMSCAMIYSDAPQSPAGVAEMGAMRLHQFELGLAILVAGGLMIGAGGWTWFRRPSRGG